MNLRINSPEANLRATPNTTQAPLARLPAGHPVTALAEAVNNWRACRATIDGNTFEGFIHTSLLRPEISPVVDRLVEAAGAEYKRFLFGMRHETHPEAEARVRDYWHAFQAVAPPVSEAWSAAFISFLMHGANLPKSFRFSGRHTTYLSDSKIAKEHDDTSRAYWAVRLEERTLEIGDLVGAYRTGDGCGSTVRTYDSLPGDFCAHVDLVGAIRGGAAITLGGNLSNTVKDSTIPLTATGAAGTGSKRIVTMARNF